MIDYIKNIVLALAITLIIELLIAVLFGFRNKWELVTVFLINVITNPLMNYLLSINYYFHIISQYVVLLIILEVIFIFVEWRLLVFILNSNSKKMFVLSTVMNTCSCVAGLLIFTWLIVQYYYPTIPGSYYCQAIYIFSIAEN